MENFTNNQKKSCMKFYNILKNPFDHKKIVYITDCFENGNLGTCHFDDPLTDIEKKEISVYMDIYHQPWFFCCDGTGIQSKHPKFDEE